MFERVVLGVDPGTRAVGLAIVACRGGSTRPTVRSAVTVRTLPDDPAAQRLGQIAEAVRQVIAANRPESVAIERLMWNRNVVSAMEVARASGAILATAAEADLHVEEYGPLEVKLAVTGFGNASKEQVRRGLRMLLGDGQVPEEPDAADAVAIACCHVQQWTMRRLLREAD
jgi:crossover junction endodeoxyribonuclease RuvC